MVTFSQLAKIVAGKIISFSEDWPIESLCIDSRKAAASAGTIFFAIRGERHDGHHYLRSLHQSGIRQFVIEETDIDVKPMAGCNILHVSSSVVALQRLAAFHRDQFAIPVIGITGSNGKTIIKEWLFQMLSMDKIVVKNPGSYNSQVGVPLSVWQLQAHHQIGIFEAGISRPGEMERLAAVIKPAIGIFTNIGSAHDEGFTDRIEKIEEKLKLFAQSDIVIYCRDHVDVHAAISGKKLPAFTWGTSGDIAVEFAGVDKSAVEEDKSAVKEDKSAVKEDESRIRLKYKGVDHELNIAFSDRASKENVMHCIAAMLYMNYDLSDLQRRLDGIRAIPMRMELKEGINDCQVIDDTYNNDLGGLELALQFLSNQHQKKKKRLIISDILESGLHDDELIRNMSAIIHRHHIDAIVGIGNILRKLESRHGESVQFFPTTQDFLIHFDFTKLHDEIILVKGARKFLFERIVSRLQRKVHGTIMEIDLDALIHNFNFFKSLLKPATKVMVMVKAFAYGSGSTEIANLLQYHQADYLGVAYADEGIELRKNNITLPIMVMNPSEQSFESLLAYGLEPEIYSLRIFQLLVKFLSGRPCSVHIKIDTGMHRLGFENSMLDDLLVLLRANPNVRVASIFTHLAGADERKHDNFSSQQYSNFLQVADIITNSLGYRPLYHALNTPGILRLSAYQLDMVRLGIGLYGVDPTDNDAGQLKPVATLKSIISQVKTINKGETIGYGRAGSAVTDITIATIALGYADGYSRAFSGGVGEVLVNGKLSKVIGNVCMDMTMIDVTGLEANEGDEVTIFGRELPIQTIAAKINTIPYEILTSTSERVKRVFITNGI